MSESWAVAGIWFLGIVILVAAAIVVWPRRQDIWPRKQRIPYAELNRYRITPRFNVGSDVHDRT